MKKWLLIFSLLFANERAYTELPAILVSIPTYQPIVQDLIGEKATVHSVVPKGTHLHSFEPSPSGIEVIKRASLWFILGDPFEQKILSSLPNIRPRIIDLREGLLLISSHHCQKEGADTHIWLSPRLMLQQLSTIASALKVAFPECSEHIDATLARYQQECDVLIQFGDTSLKMCSGKSIVIAHGAYGYLLHEYGISQLAIEQEGKEPTVRQLTTLLQAAEKEGVHTVFSLRQYSQRGIERVAKLLHAKIIELDPYSEDYFTSMRYTIESFHAALLQQRTES